MFGSNHAITQVILLALPVRQIDAIAVVLQSFGVCSYLSICLHVFVCVCFKQQKKSLLDVCVLWFGLFVCKCMFILLRPTFQLPNYLCASLPALARQPGFRSTHICSSTMTLPMSPRRCSVGVRVMFRKPSSECMDSTLKPLCLT